MVWGWGPARGYPPPTVTPERTPPPRRPSSDRGGQPAGRRGAGLAYLALAAAALALPAAALGGCKSATEQRVTADREAYRALDARRPQVSDVRGSLDLDAADRVARPARALTDVVLDLDEALRLAAAASYDYREARERAYLSALALSNARQEFAAQGGLGAAGSVARDGDGTTVEGGPAGSLSRAFESGGSFVLKLATNFLKLLSTNPVETAQSILAAEFVLPLVRGSGTAAREDLTQAERDVLYELRSFARFQQDLVVTVASGYYDVLQSKDVLTNEELTYQSLLLVHERAKAFGPEGAGRLPDFEVDQARQDVLRAEDRRQQARQAYEASLDRFKRTLGIPVQTRLTLEEGALDALRAAGIVGGEGALGEALATALSRRLDLATARDRVDDARRKLDVAANALGADVALRATGTVDTSSRRPFGLRGTTPRGSVGLDVDLPIERTAERNAYRAAEIEVERARRDVEGLEDDVTASVRSALRELAQARRSFEIQKEGVRLAERRVESAKLNLQAGKATIRDVLDAENALVEARNALTAALVNHAIAKLELDRDVGTLDASILASPTVPPSVAAPAGTVPPPPAAPAVAAPATAPTPGPVPAQASGAVGGAADPSRPPPPPAAPAVAAPVAPR